MNLHFALPLGLVLLLAVPGYLLLQRRAERPPIPLPRARSGGRQRRWGGVANVPILLRAFVLAALALAVAGPSTSGAIIEEGGGGVPIVVAIDISSSMLAQDFQPRDRLTVARETLARFVEARPHDPVGLVAFAGEALTLVPVTHHRPVLTHALTALRVGLLEDGTAIGDGLAAALNRLVAIDAADAVVILLSDGENNRGRTDPLAAADAAAVLGVRVFTIGVGSEGVARVPVGSAPAGFQYAERPVGLDEELLREIASRTGGAYFRATDPSALDRVYGEIDRMVPTVVSTTRTVRHRSWSHIFLLFAAGLLALEWGVRGSRWGAVP